MLVEFAARTAHLLPEGAYVVHGRAQELERSGRKILHLELGEPDAPTPDAIKSAGIQAIAAGRTRYTRPAGIHQLREAIAEHAGKQRGVPVSPEMVVVAPGTKPGLFLTMLALLQPGDEVIYPDPGFPTYSTVVRFSGATGVPIRLSEEDGFSFDLEAFDRLVSPKTKLIVLNSPSNPTGGVVSEMDLAHIARRARECDAWLLSDEIYSRLVFDDLRTAPSVLSQEGMLDRTVVVDGFSKAFAMTGWRLGYMIAPPRLAATLELLVTHATGSSAEFTQLAGLEALTGPQDELGAMRAEFQSRRDRLVTLLNAIPGVTCLTPGGAFYAFPNIKSFGLPAAELQRRLLDEAGVAVLAGTDFGPGGEGYLRLSYAADPGVLEEAVAKIQEFLARV